MKNCQNCKQEFEVTAKDREFLEMLKVPEPTWCPQCRSIRRLAFRNDRSLYKRKCDLCQKESIMQYPSDAPFVVYCKTCWYSDGWDATTYARDYDFNRPFFAQFKELMSVVPRLGLIHQNENINSEYTNRIADSKNCYLVFSSTAPEDCRYSAWANHSKNCQDCYAAIKSERCYDCVDSTNCYQLAFSSDCINCRDSWFLHNCQNVTNSFGCVNVRNKQYCFFNEQLTKEEYEKKIAELGLDSAAAIEKARQRFEEFKKQFIVPALVARRSVGATGNWLDDCKDATQSFNCQNNEHIRHCFSVYNGKDIMDHSHWSAGSERTYECSSVGFGCSNLHFAFECWTQMMDSEYVANCMKSKNLFGCIGLRNKEYCILNKQYSKDEYFALVEKIKKQMDEMPYVDAAGRVYKYGEFFPFDLSAFSYNEALVQEFYPIDKDEAAKMKLRWRDTAEKSYKITIASDSVPDKISEVGESALKEIFGCEHQGGCKHQCTTAFRLIPEELQMYKNANLPLPKLCPNCRHFGRLEKRNPMQLWQRACQCTGAVTHQHGETACQNKFETSYSPDRPEKVYCLECYQQEVA